MGVIIIIINLIKRMIIELKDKKNPIVTPQNVYDIVAELLEAEGKIDMDKEHVYVFHLDTQSRIKIVELVSLGSLNSSIVHPREVFTRAVIERSASIVLAHNHPSGNNEPSSADIDITDRINKAGNILGIKLQDHVICGKDTYYSFRENHNIL